MVDRHYEGFKENALSPGMIAVEDVKQRDLQDCGIPLGHAIKIIKAAKAQTANGSHARVATETELVFAKSSAVAVSTSTTASAASFGRGADKALQPLHVNVNRHALTTSGILEKPRGLEYLADEHLQVRTAPHRVSDEGSTVNRVGRISSLQDPRGLAPDHSRALRVSFGGGTVVPATTSEASFSMDASKVSATVSNEVMIARASLPIDTSNPSKTSAAVGLSGKPQEEFTAQELRLLLKSQMEQFSELRELLLKGAAEQSGVGIAGAGAGAASSLGTNESEVGQRIRHQQNILYAASSLTKWRKIKRWYNEIFDGDFETDSMDKIVNSVCNAILDNMNSKAASTHRDRLGDINTLLEIMDRTSEVSSSVNKNRVDLSRVLQKKESSDRKQGKAVGWIALADADFLHMINTVLDQHNGKFPTEKIQQIHMLMVSKVTARRTGERTWIAASSWTLRSDILANGNIIRVMSYTYCFQKGVGVGKYPFSFMETSDTPVESDLVVLTLLLLERLGMIKSALDVYENHAPLVVDPDTFETPDELVAKLNAALVSSKEGDLKKILNDGDDSDEIKFPDSVMPSVRAADAKSNKVPMYITFPNNYPRRIRYDKHANTMRMFGRLVGYTPTPQIRFGGTAGRKGFRQDSKNALAANINYECHLITHMGHESTVAYKHYENKIAYKFLPIFCKTR